MLGLEGSWWIHPFTGPLSCVHFAKMSRNSFCSLGSCCGRIICSPVSRWCGWDGFAPFSLQRVLHRAGVSRHGAVVELRFIKQCFKPYLNMNIVPFCWFAELSSCCTGFLFTTCHEKSFLLKILVKFVLVRARKFPIKNTVHNWGRKILIIHECVYSVLALGTNITKQDCRSYS